jgi:hypothetical protein
VPINIENFIRSLKADALPRLRAECARGLNLFGQMVLEEAQRLCPRDTGFLQDTSPFLEPATPSNLKCTIGFNAAYAVYVHENLEAHHPKGGQAKFLEVPMQAAAPELSPFILNHLQQSLGGGA